ncbi:GMC oxidoreductase [Burkholderia pseudomultivorans]|uniref:GMC oxidoreductase n=1 Tax=Burkholderia pseudomultivorans TaxID=1207504 RepID=UPI0012D9740C
MELKSPDSLQPPSFHPDCLSDPGDIRRSIAGLRLMRRIAETVPSAPKGFAGRVCDRTAAPLAPLDQRCLPKNGASFDTASRICSGVS